MVAFRLLLANHLFQWNALSPSCHNLNILQVKGRSDLFLKLEIIKKIIAMGPMVVGIVYGIEYMLWGGVSISFIAYFLNSYYSANLINYPTSEQIKDVLPTFLTSFVVAAFMWGVSFWNISVYALLPIQILSGICWHYLYMKSCILMSISKSNSWFLMP